MIIKLAAAALTLAGGLALAPGAALAAPAAPASAQSAALAAPGFNAGGTYRLFQSNGATPQVNVTQDGSGRLFGTASGDNAVGTIEEGAVEGTSISFTIGWSNGSRGRYIGSLGSDRRLTGTTFDLAHPTSQATWFTDRTF
ncbi:hypothetical protein [Actinomadura sp. NPDC000600]|uniref:hypothetical protein n=1 Tax=Actinomadura sp. NPDC000600 TaxID=3154262 RepID=UPI003399F845